jgi:hypothetical protein
MSHQLIFSPGLVQGCFQLIGIVARQRLSLQDIKTAFPRLGSVPVDRVVALSRELGWIDFVDEKKTLLTKAGEKILAATVYEKMLRIAIFDYIAARNPVWVHNAQHGRAKVLSFLDVPTAQIFAEAGLTCELSQDILEFWDKLAALAREQKNAALLDIGRTGERLSIAFEKSRTNASPEWTAVEKPNAGYDILSIVSSSDPRPLSIEVKTSTAGPRGHLHLTRNEWEWANSSENHLFHIWDLEVQGSPKLAVLSTESIAAHAPKDSGEGDWEVVRLPISCFQGLFEIPMSSRLEYSHTQDLR